MQDGQQLVGSSGIESVLAGCLPAPALERARRLEAESGERIRHIIVASVLATSRGETRPAQRDQKIAEFGTIAGGALNIAILRLLNPSISMKRFKRLVAVPCLTAIHCSDVCAMRRPRASILL